MIKYCLFQQILTSVCLEKTSAPKMLTASTRSGVTSVNVELDLLATALSVKVRVT